MGKTTDIWMPVFIGDLLSDTLHLSPAEFGAYHLILYQLWVRGPIPERSLKSVTRMSDAQWRESEATLKAFLLLNADGNWYQGRAAKEKKKADELSAISRTNGSKGGRPRNPENPGRTQTITQTEPRHKPTEEPQIPAILAPEGENRTLNLENNPENPESNPDHNLDRTQRQTPSQSPLPLKKQKQQPLSPSAPPGDAGPVGDPLNSNEPDPEPTLPLLLRAAEHPPPEPAKAAVTRVFAYFLRKTGRRATQYELTEPRMKVGLRAYGVCQKRFPGTNACGDDRAELAMAEAVLGMASNKHLMGENDRNRRYCHWIENCFKNVEEMEKRWEDAGGCNV